MALFSLLDLFLCLVDHGNTRLDEEGSTSELAHCEHGSVTHS